VELVTLDEGKSQTRSQQPPPAATSDSVFDGSWMIAEEKYLREAAPLTWWISSTH
jgi:hypothetical protein